jgi:hypothetical protein
MSEISQEWVDKAEGDYHTALREYRARKEPKGHGKNKSSVFWFWRYGDKPLFESFSFA